MDDSKGTLVIGAGVSGMACARVLTSAGQSVTVLDKGRGPGGRLATRVSRSGPVFDHGAQYLTARSVTFQQQVDAWIDAGVAAKWDGRFVDLRDDGPLHATVREAERYVGTPGMSSIVASMCGSADGLDGPHHGVRVGALEKTDAGWMAQDEASGSYGPFARCVVSVPPPQARELLAKPAPGLADDLGDATVQPTWTLMLSFADPLDLDEPFDAAFVERQDNELSMICRNSGKPGRPTIDKSGDCWVAHARSDWSQQHLEDDRAAVAATLVAAFSRAVRRPMPTPAYAAVHRWRYANTVEPLPDRWLYDPDLGLGVCGDACTAGSHTNIERAYLSGLGLGERLAGH
ncbi:MAG: FAD-dependent oxidoreductase [Planctomycetota bacterium]